MVQNLEYYKVFYYVSKEGSLTKAASKLSISQPAVSQAIKQLETGLGVKLLHRVSKGMKLTKEGEILYSYIQKGFEQIVLGENALKGIMSLEGGEIRIGSSDMTLQYYLLPFLEAFHEKYPQIKVQVTNGPTPETLELLREGKIDFGIVTTPFEIHRDFCVKNVREIEDIFVAGHKYTQLKNHMIDLSQLLSFPIISLEKNTSSRKYMDEYLMNEGIHLRPEFELATSDMIVQFALRNLGVGCVVKDFALEYLESGRLFELRFNKMIPKRNMCVVINKKLSSTQASLKLLELLNKIS